MIAQLVNSFRTWFWNPDVWLPPQIEWKDIVPNEKVNYPRFEDLIYPIPLALVIMIVRYIIEKKFYNPLGLKVGIKIAKRRVIKHYDELENAYRSKKKLSHREIENLGKKVDLETRQVERWFRHRLARDKLTTLAKFSESGFRFTFYGLSLFAGLCILWNKPWFWDINYCWYEYPHHSVTPDVWWYYMLASSFYWSLMFSQFFFDAKRKDFWQMFLHHATTICLLGFSWTCNLTRIGTLVLLLHDCADAFLEVAKMSKYANLDKLCDILFAIFAIIWVITRLGVFPVYILNSTMFEAPMIVPMFPAYYIFNSMLLVLLCLHVFWTYFICKVAFNALASGKVEGDTRSSTESENEDESDTSSINNSLHNNSINKNKLL